MSMLATRDTRTLFERAWSRALREGRIDAARREALVTEAVKAMRRIAGLLGSEALREDLERAQRAMLGLINLHLHTVSGGDEALAARSIAERGLLFHTKGASQAIKRILALELGDDLENLHPAMVQRLDAEVVGQWALLAPAQFAARAREAAERRARYGAAQVMRGLLEGPPPDLDPAMSEPLVMTALLILAYDQKRAWIQDLRGFEALLERVRSDPQRFRTLPEGVPAPYRRLVTQIWSEQAPGLMALLTDASVPVHRLLSGLDDGPGSALLGRLMLPDSALAEVDAFEADASSHWSRLTGGRSDDETLLTVLLTGLLGPRTVPALSAAASERLLRQAVTALPEPRQVEAWLETEAPHAYHEGLRELWDAFVDALEQELSADTPTAALKRFAREWLRIEVRTARTARA